MLAGILITPLFLIPLIGTQASYIFLSMIIVLSGVYLIIRDSRLIRIFRFAFAFSALMVFILIVLVLRMLNVSQRNRVSNGIYEGSTLSARYVANPDGSGSVLVNGDYYFGTDRASLQEQILSTSIPLLIKHEVQKAFFMGFNTGISVSILDKYGIPEINISEISPELIRLSSVVFANQNNDVLTESSVRLTLNDPRVQLVKSKGLFDLIYSGSEQFLLYPGRYTVDFLRICNQKLSDDGLYCQVLPYDKIDSLTFVTIYKSCAEAFRYTSLWHIADGRLMIIASKNTMTPDFCAFSANLIKLENPWLHLLGIGKAENILGHFIFSGNPFGKITSPDNSDLMPQLCFRFKDTSKNDLINFLNYSRPHESFRVSDSCMLNKSEILKTVSDINYQLLQNVSPFSNAENAADSSVMKDLPFRQYP
jgi:spermidine synthase